MASNGRTGFLDLPPELRNAVYHEVAEAETDVVFKIDEHTDDPVDDMIGSAPITQVCRQLRAEATPVIRAIAAFKATEYTFLMTGFEFGRISEFSDRMLEAHNGKLATPCELRLRFKLVDRTADTLLPIQKNSDASVFRFLQHFAPPLIHFRFDLRTEGMDAQQQEMTVTHEQVKRIIARLYDLTRVLSRPYSPWSPTFCTRRLALHVGFDHVEGCRDLLKRVYQEHKEPVWKRRARYEAAGAARVLRQKK